VEWVNNCTYLSVGRYNIVVVIEAYHFCQLCANFTQHPAVKEIHIQRKLLGIINVDFDATGQILITYSAFVQCLKKTGIQWNNASAHYRLRGSLCDSDRREDLYNNLIETGISMNLLWLIKMCLTETYSRVQVGKHLSDMFPIRNGLKQRDALSSLFYNFS
jgi:hypothetical protein